MKFYSHKSLAAFVVVALALLIGCQNSITEPQPATNASVEYIKAGPKVLGLAKGELSITKTVTTNNGAYLGGPDMEGNYVSIPGGALDENMSMTFTIEVTDDGILLFSVEGAGVPEGEHIYFNDDKTATMAVNKDWLAAEPNVAVNIGTDEQYDVTEIDTHYLVELPHFTGYAWAITD
ncbi:MAG: hypothetical protein MAGBODY4_00794 [Candidatus Marinimicrobia bacterium]|nr:hypothetical protein [Candidatus Neomarinimicrobiota bacterium]